MNEIIRPISEELKLSDNVELFGFIAQCIKDIQPENGIKIGFTFSYPCILTSRKSGILLEWTKGINASSCIGKDPVQLLQQELTKLGVNAHIVSMCNDSVSTLIRNILLSFAQFERDMIVERTQAGKAIARTKAGFKEGRPAIKADKINNALDLLDNGKTYKEVVSITGISKSTLIRAMNKRKAQQQTPAGTPEET